MVQDVEIKMPIQKIMGCMILKISLTGLNIFKLRMYLGTRLIKLASIVMGCRVQID